MFAGNSADKDLLAEPTLSPEPRTTDLCSVGSPFFALLHTRKRNLEAEQGDADCDPVRAGCLLQPERGPNRARKGHEQGQIRAQTGPKQGQAPAFVCWREHMRAAHVTPAERSVTAEKRLLTVSSDPWRGPAQLAACSGATRVIFLHPGWRSESESM